MINIMSNSGGVNKNKIVEERISSLNELLRKLTTLKQLKNNSGVTYTRTQIKAILDTHYGKNVNVNMDSLTRQLNTPDFRFNRNKLNDSTFKNSIQRKTKATTGGNHKSSGTGGNNNNNGNGNGGNPKTNGNGKLLSELIKLLYNKNISEDIKRKQINNILNKPGLIGEINTMTENRKRKVHEEVYRKLENGFNNQHEKLKKYLGIIKAHNNLKNNRNGK